MDEANLLERFSKLGYITKEQAQKAISSKEKNEDIITTLLRLGFMDDEKLLNFYTKYTPQKLWKGDLKSINIPAEILNKIPQEILKKTSDSTSVLPRWQANCGYGQSFQSICHK